MNPTPNPQEPKPDVLGPVPAPVEQKMSEHYADASMYQAMACGHCGMEVPSLYMHGQVCRYCFQAGH